MAAREQWSSRLGFILAAAGSAIGLGTMWMLPYVMGKNGGGAFILLFLGFTLLVGIPLFICELLLGREAQRGVVGTFAKFSHEDSTWRAMGWLGVITTYLVAGWYAVVAGWGFNYILMSLADAFRGRDAEHIGMLFDTFRASGDLNVFWQVVFLFVTASVVFRGISKGIEYWARILTSTLFVMLMGLAIYSATLSGFGQAVDYILVPNFDAVDGSTVLKALAMALFTLSLGEGIMITYGSYMKKTDDIPKTAIIVGVSIIGISVLVALMIFPMVFTFGFAPQAGEGLIFKTLPFVFENLPGSILLSGCFFTLLAFAAITSSVAQFEVIVANHIDLHKWSRTKATIVALVGCLLVGLPTALAASPYAIFPTWNAVFKHSFLDTNYILIDWALCVFGFATSIFVGWVIPAKHRIDGFREGSSLKVLYYPWLLLVRYLVPLSILLVMLNQAHLIDVGSWF